LGLAPGLRHAGAGFAEATVLLASLGNA